MMVEHSDEVLLNRIAAGDQNAFVELIGRYEQPLAALIRYRIGNPDDAEDVLQDTLVAAWIGLSRLRRPENVRAWLLQVARNRCRDYFKSSHRRDYPMENTELEMFVDRLGFMSDRNDKVTLDILDALDELSQAEQETAKSFYLHGFTLKEIAERSMSPVGTVKRRLHDARERLRQALGVSVEGKVIKIKASNELNPQPFPDVKLQISVSPLAGTLPPIDCREMRWWSIIPVVGSRALRADYTAPDWKVTRVWDLRAVRRAYIHEVEGVEIEVEEWRREEGWLLQNLFFYGRLLDDRAQWLGGMRKMEEETQMRTFLDEGYVWAFPDQFRTLTSEDLFITELDGSLKTTRKHDDFFWSGAGYFEVRIGDNVFRCLRMIGLEGPLTSADTAVTEGFISDSGRVVLIRLYTPAANGDLAKDSLTLTIDGHTFVHYQDTLTDTACAIPL